MLGGLIQNFLWAGLRISLFYLCRLPPAQMSRINEMSYIPKMGISAFKLLPFGSCNICPPYAGGYMYLSFKLKCYRCRITLDMFTSAALADRRTEELVNGVDIRWTVRIRFYVGIVCFLCPAVVIVVFLKSSLPSLSNFFSLFFAYVSLFSPPTTHTRFSCWF